MMKFNQIMAGVLAVTFFCGGASAAERYVKADDAQTWIASHARKGKISANALLWWMRNNQKLGTLTLEPDEDNPVYPTHQLSFVEVLVAAEEAGFTTEKQLLAMLAIAVSESSLWSADRNFHREYGLRPATDVIGVHGSDDMWVGDQQYHSDRGVWQISSKWWPMFPDLTCDSPALAAEAAWILSQHGTDFHLWDPYKNGVAQRHYDIAFDGWPALRPIVREFLNTS